jgi:hypothetical protein
LDVFSQPEPLLTQSPGTAGGIASTGIPRRPIQFALKLEFHPTRPKPDRTMRRR